MPFQYPPKTRVKKKMIGNSKMDRLFYSHTAPVAWWLPLRYPLHSRFSLRWPFLGATLGIVNCGAVSSSQSVGRTDRAPKGSFLLPDWIGDFEWSTRWQIAPEPWYTRSTPWAVMWLSSEKKKAWRLEQDERIFCLLRLPFGGRSLQE